MILKPKYKVDMIERDNKHIYIVDGEEFLSVSEYLDIIGGKKTRALKSWQEREVLKATKELLWECLKIKGRISGFDIKDIMNTAIWKPDQIFKEAGRKGHKIHEVIHAYIMGMPFELDDETRPAFNNFMEWLSKEDITLTMSEVEVASKKYRFGGKLDAGGTNKAKESILFDWKSSNALRDETALQTGGYDQGYFETYGKRFDRAFAIRFGKKNPNDFEPREVNLPLARNGFKGALGLYNTMNSKLWK